VPNQRRNARARDYNTAAIPSRNPFSVSPRTSSAENTCEHWRPSKTLSRGDTTREGVRRLPEASRSLSRPITRTNHSIASAYQSNCINGYRQGSHSVINQRDSSNVLGYQVSLELQAIENHSQKGYQVSLELHDHNTYQYHQSITIRILIRAQYDSVSRPGIDQDSYHDQGLITIRISITIRYDSVSRSSNNQDSYQGQSPITIMISIAIRSQSASALRFDHNPYQHRNLIRIRIRIENRPES